MSNKWICGLFIFFVVCAVTIETYIATYIHNQYVDNEVTNIHNNIAHTTTNLKLQFNNIMARIQYTLIRTTSLFRIKYMQDIYVTPQEYVDNIYLSNDPLKPISGTIVWMPQLQYDQLESYTTFCKMNITSDCHIYQMNNNTKENVTLRDYYYPIMLYTPPFSLSNTNIGLDMNYGSTKRIIDSAFTSSQMTASSRILFNNQFVIPLSQLVFKNTSSTFVNQTYVSGILTMALNISYIFDVVIRINGNLNRDDVSVFLYDKSDNMALLYSDKLSNDEYVSTDFYTVGHRTWMVTYQFSETYINQYRNNDKNTIVNIIIGVFLLFDIIIIMLFYVYYKTTKMRQEEHTVSNNILQYVNHELRNPMFVINGMIEHLIDTFKKKTGVMFKYLESPQINASRTLTPKSEEKRLVDSPDSQNMRTSLQNIEFTQDEMKSLISNLQTAYSSCGAMKHIVDDVLDVVKTKEGKMPVDNKEFELYEMLDYVKRSVKPRIDERFHIAFKVDCPKELKRSVLYTDKSKLSQILLNFIFNAIKFTTHGFITLRIFRCDQMLRFEVIDTGRGIPEDKRDYIFQPFHQVKEEDTTRYGGIGVGLYLCSVLIKLLEGTIGFSSVIDSGSTFWIEIPISHSKKNTVVIHK